MSEELLIHELAPLGDGVHRSGQGRVYVERTLPGERVTATLRAEAGGIVRGDVVEIIEASPERAAPPCVHYDLCGGCSLQHARETYSRKWKCDIVRAALARQGLEPRVWSDPVFVPAGTRRRVTFAAMKKNNGVTLGYFRRRTHQVTAIDGCLVAEPKIMDLRAKLGAALVPVLKEGKAADIFIQVVDGQSEIVVTGPVGKTGRPDLNVRQAVAQLAHGLGVARVSWRPKDRGEPEVLVEVAPLMAKFGALPVALPPLAFLQPTKAGEAALVAAVMGALPPSGTFADLFAGCGTFTGPMLTRGPVDAFESATSAVRALDKAKGAVPLRASRRDLFRQPLHRDEARRYDAIVFDPPRAGAQEQAKALAGAITPWLVGVSCNPVTFARDARVLVEGGYKLRSVQIVDQFTWSHHVELVASFIR